MFLVNTTLAMTTALLVKDGEIPLMSHLPLFHTVRRLLPGVQCAPPPHRRCSRRSVSRPC